MCIHAHIHMHLHTHVGIYTHTYACVYRHTNMIMHFWWGVHSFHQHLEGTHFRKLVKNLCAKWGPILSVIRNKQIKTTRRYHYIPSRTAVIKKTSNTEYWWECGEAGPLIRCWWECKMAQSPWKTACQFPIKWKLNLPCGPAISLLVIYQREWKHMSTQRAVHKCS